MITFYDVPSKLPDPWSLINWRIRLILKYKSLPFQTEWIEYPDIEPFSKSHGIPPTGTKPDGSPFYTLPAIYDDTTGLYISDSLPIAKYLDTTYPDTPVVVPVGTEGLMQGFLQACIAIWRPYMGNLYLRFIEVLNPVSAKYIAETRAAMFGAPLEDIALKGEERKKVWEGVKKGMEEVGKWYESTPGRFIMGDQPTLVDFVIAPILSGVRTLFGTDGEEWKDVCEWDGGRWEKWVKDLEGLCNKE